jgi:hypothetical protein
MIISFQHDYIFIRTKKTASTTVEEVLSASLGPDDTVTSRGVTSVSAEPSAVNGAHGDFKRFRKVKHLGKRKSPPFHAHMMAVEISGRVTRRFWRHAFKFTVERHPYEKAMSLAYYKFGKKDKMDEKGRPVSEDFPTHLDSVVREGRYRSFEYYSIDGESVMDDFIRQENLQADMKRIGERLGIPIPDELPRRKATYRLDPRPAREVLSQEQKDIIYKCCREEFELLGYER